MRYSDAASADCLDRTIEKLSRPIIAHCWINCEPRKINIYEARRSHVHGADPWKWYLINVHGVFTVARKTPHKITVLFMARNYVDRGRWLERAPIKSTAVRNGVTSPFSSASARTLCASMRFHLHRPLGTLIVSYGRAAARLITCGCSRRERLARRTHAAGWH